MKKFAYTAIAAAALGTGLFGLAGTAQAAPATQPLTIISAGTDHLGWINDIQPTVTVPQVDTSVRHSGR